MTDDQLAHVEQQLARVSDELRQTRRQLRMVLGRDRRSARRAWTLGTAGLLMALAVGAVGTAATATSAQPLTMSTPFRVLDGSGAVVMQVVSRPDNEIQLWRGGTIAALMAATGAGNLIKLFNAHGQTIASVQDNAGSGEVVIGQPNTPTVRLGVRDGKTALRFFNGANVVSAIGATALGGAIVLNNTAGNPMVRAGANQHGGGVLVYDVAGHIRTSDEIDASGAGAFKVQGAGGAVVGNLTERKLDGYLGLANPYGNAAVEAGILPDGRGIVRTYPEGGLNWFIEGK